MTLNPAKIRATLRRKSHLHAALMFLIEITIQSAIGIGIVLFGVWLFITINGALHP